MNWHCVCTYQEIDFFIHFKHPKRQETTDQKDARFQRLDDLTHNANVFMLEGRLLQKTIQLHYASSSALVAHTDI